MKNQLTFSLIAIGLALLILAPQTHAQRLQAQVTVNTEKLLLDAKNKLAPLQDQLTRYVNDFDWTDNTGRYDIPVQISIFIDQAAATSYEDRYNATVAISSQSDFQTSDKKWLFAYQQGSQLTHSDQFQSLTSLIDFYLYALLGQEYDKKTKLGGSTYYQKAFQVAQLSKFTEFFDVGWKERSAYIDRIQSEAQKPYRQLEYFFSQAQYRLRVDDRKTSGQYLRATIIKLRSLSPEDPATARFYEMHSLDMARMLSTMGLTDQLQILSGMDQAHVATYQQFLQKPGGQ